VRIPNFSAKNNLNKLLKINDIIKNNGYYKSSEHIFINVAKKEWFEVRSSD